MTTTFAMTRNQIIHKAYRKAGILGEGEDMSAEMLDEAANDLNLIIKNLEKHRRKLWAVETLTSVVLPASQVSYLGSNYVCILTHLSSALILPTNPLYWRSITTTATLSAWVLATSYSGSSFEAPTGTTAIEFATIHETTTPESREEIELINRFDEGKMPDILETGVPTSLFFQRYPSPGKVHLFPIPDRSVTLTYSRIRLLEDVTDAGQFPDVPVTLIAYLIYELASEIAEEYDREEAKIMRLRTKAQTELALAIRNQKEYVDYDVISSAY